MDKISAEQRSENMRRIRSEDTSPEMLVRRTVHGLGYRYRLHGQDLPGKPDLVFAGRRKVIFVNGCFWHGHEDPGCPIVRLPKSNPDYWLPKLERNKERDVANRAALKKANWDVLTVWECETRDSDTLAKTIRKFLGSRANKRTRIDTR